MKLYLFVLLAVASLPAQSQPSIHLADFKEAGLVSEDSLLLVKHEEGHPLFRGALRNGKLQGSWTSWYASGKKCDEGSLEKGVPDGVWKTWYANGQLRHVRNYSYVKWVRIREELNKPVKHPLYPITRIARTRPGAGLRSLPPDNSFQRSSPGTTIHAIVNSNIAGEPGYTPVFAQCVLHGLYLNYAEDGSLLDSGYYKNGLRDGVWAEWATDRSVRGTGAYRNGQRDREWKYYDAANRLRYIIIYKQGQLQFRKDIS